MEATYSIFQLAHAFLVVPGKNQATAYADLIDSVLLAQLVADGKVKGDSEASWYDLYVSVLDDFWLRQSKVRHDINISDHGSDSFFEWLTQAVTLLAPDGSRYLIPALHQITSSADLHATVSSNNNHAGSESAAQWLSRPGALVIVAQSPTSFTSVYVELTTRQQTVFQPWERFQTELVNGAVSLRFAQASLSEVLYRPVRRAIAVKVKNKLNANLRPLEASAITCSKKVQS